ncbi:acetyl-CoA carboxylase biotin carboxylase subunit [Brenneria goodwinii]|uniref:acetyl-CoA carboxylase biotin carboxylase subunit n=1 Tax=Brenneria goodwinii TaxID=1109412 RepID=UPI000EF2291B|nr:acetyl-CoA carboxylase biotin carboxylase subunit [Brenneria goodwinii]MCG8155639.1 acetyl-CoA carboxylase biotin carboxylase subunit [Brenneria goodwinii]MCG8160334.1 acetyl-CoA carboxylase biotin carboxylase subunit [Brenneria goodwinii]MCG8164857.1 acetyl-CoA carboxylase biotin carboxylase subunit [Brenneria goodwinii]MCG8169486.1 acetyl-CoA carboxylase biotin carboxylase subunit [Brenneria goodwinii]MCG8174660.1 acetyl-CoA carboxylase biotin carboxylase subunit [Brenneria goodwinii]
METPIKKLLIANRGEIAVRIIHAAKSLGIPTVAACSDADTDALPARLADEVYILGPARADQSYLNVDALLQGARLCGADAIHPGYGFLSENADFAQAVEQAGLRFIGPTPQTIRMMGDKAVARRTAQKAGVPVVPGSTAALGNIDAALQCAEEIGYPLLIKAAAGGGGRGIRVVANAAELARDFPIAQNESNAAFGCGDVYLERFIQHARHIEVQILGDGERVIHLYERECSLQRRRQKIFEEAPSPALSPVQREAICHSALQLAQQLRYRGAGTLEYLFDEDSGEFYFIEMNTRIQVEHPVTEMVTGVDLVQWMLRIAQGEKLSLRQQDIALSGNACEMRINAEDPDRNFFPCPGVVEKLLWPQGDGIRIDSHLFSGYRIPPYYDSLLAKLVVHGPDRRQMLARAELALRQLRLTGIVTTQSLHQWLIADPRLRAGQFDTTALEEWLKARAQAKTPISRGA